jgi:DNA-binding NtrC family response regulator
MPVILMTGFGEIMKVAGKTPPHIREILSKPFTGEELRQMLTRVLKQ